jgi:NAD(P)-dependent dehydrogenase (short-subunit alcohol dehydrogenase family)
MLSRNFRSLVGRTVLITGGNAGIGFQVAKVLSSDHGANVVIAGRNKERVENALSILRPLANGGEVHGEVVDLASLNSIDHFSTQIRHRFPSLDVLINNAGVFVPPHTKTEQGWDVQLGTNALGTFYLTHKLMPQLIKAPDARVVTLTSSFANLPSEADLNQLLLDVGGSKRTPPSTLADYAASKLLNILFTIELESRLRRAGTRVEAFAADPGYIRTELAGKSDK